MPRDWNLFEKLHNIARQQACQDRSQESRLHLTRKVSPKKSGNQSRLAGDGIGDVAPQHGQHQCKRCRSNVIHELEPRCLRKIWPRGSHGREGDSECYQQASAGDEGNGERNTREQVLPKVLEHFRHRSPMLQSATTKNVVHCSRKLAQRILAKCGPVMFTSHHPGFSKQ